MAAAARAPGETSQLPLRKRGRDIHGVDRFREVVYGEKGIAQLHAMVTRNPVLMYPPDGVAEARTRVLQRQQQQQRRQRREEMHESNDDDDDWDDEEEEDEEDEQQDGERVAHARSGIALKVCADENVCVNVARGCCDSSGGDGNGTRDNTATLVTDAVAHYHHKQLDALLRLMYEFNHATFVKLTMQDTLRLLSRCGREAVAHLMEHEMHQRLAHDTRLRELCTQHSAEEAQHTHAARETAECVQRKLDVMIAATTTSSAMSDVADNTALS